MSEETSNPRIVTTPRSSPRSSIGFSILGQPSSLPDTRHPSEHNHKDAGIEDQQMDLDAVVSQLYAEVRECDPVNLILKERLDEKGGMLMDGKFCLSSIALRTEDLIVCPFSPEYATT